MRKKSPAGSMLDPLEEAFIRALARRDAERDIRRLYGNNADGDNTAPSPKQDRELERVT